MRIVRDQSKIDDMLNRCAEAQDSGESAYPGMSYEDGIQACWQWLTDKDADYPFDAEHPFNEEDADAE